MTVYDIPVLTADGRSVTLSDYRDRLLIVVNTASRCGLTPQYSELQELQTRYGDRGLSVVAFPCNQFNGQEPGSDAEIQEFCSLSYGIDFPVFAKIEVNGPGRHPLYDELTTTVDAEGVDGDVHWNFEKFLIAPGGQIVARVRPAVRPTDPVVVDVIERSLPTVMSR